MADDRPPYPPFTLETARQKVQAAEDAWNTRDPERVSKAYSEGSRWRNRDTFVTGRAEIVAFLAGKWDRELNYALRKSLWSFHDNRIAVRFQYESHDAQGQWWRSYGNELWEFDEHGLMTRREASINDVGIGATTNPRLAAGLRARPRDPTAVAFGRRRRTAGPGNGGVAEPPPIRLRRDAAFWTLSVRSTVIPSGPSPCGAL
jgi:nuclear transport factor 2 (NTF2) superfamily protein